MSPNFPWDLGYLVSSYCKSNWSHFILSKTFFCFPDFQRWIKSFCVRSSRLDCSCKGPKGQIYFPKDLTLCAVESRVWFFFYKDGAYFLPNQYESLALSFFFHEPTQSLRKLLCSISAEYQSSERRT